MNRSPISRRPCPGWALSMLGLVAVLAAVAAAADAPADQNLPLKRVVLFNSGVGFFEHASRLDVPDEAWKKTADHVVQCLRTFYRSDVFGRIRTLPAADWLDVEEFSSFPLDGTKVHVVLDFSYRDRNGHVVIYDWKTGRADSTRHEVQLACYGFYATRKWSVAPDQVTMIEFNLASGQEAPYPLAGVGLDSIRRYILSSIRDMLLLLANPETNHAVEDRFVFTDDERTCRYCNYRTICPRWGQESIKVT